MTPPAKSRVSVSLDPLINRATVNKTLMTAMSTACVIMYHVYTQHEKTGWLRGTAYHPMGLMQRASPCRDSLGLTCFDSSLLIKSLMSGRLHRTSNPVAGAVNQLVLIHAGLVIFRGVHLLFFPPFGYFLRLTAYDHPDS